MLCTKLDAECDQRAMVGRRSTVDNTWRRSTCNREIILSSEDGEKLQKELRLCMDIFEFRICLINILQLQGALSPRTWIEWRHDPKPYALVQSHIHEITVYT